MKPLVLAAALFLAPLPALAEDEPAPPGEDGFSLFGDTARTLLEDLAKRMAPALEEMEDQLGPALEALTEQLGRLDSYHAPEVLPNGDIIIRRKQPGAAPPPEPDAPDGTVDL